MKKLAIAITAVAAFTGSAVAADMQVKARPYAPPVVTAYNWTGCYVGAGGGYGMYNQDTSGLFGGGSGDGSGSGNGNGNGNGSGTVTLGGRGWFGTGQVGCDYQVMPSIVIGAFGDYNFGSITGTMGPVDEKLSWSWAAGGRIGWVALPNLLAYVSGGYTEAQFDQINFDASDYIPATTYKGWFLGSGYEYGLGFMPGLFWKTEYRFADYQAQTLSEVCLGCTGTFDSHKYVQTIRSELVYRFNWH
jgi:outer membrane immunogenic protein